MRYLYHARYIVMFILALATSQVQASSAAVDPIETSKALSALFATSNTFIPESSTCQGSYGQPGRATVKDLLAIQLAYLYSGKNAIRGSCAEKRCTVTVTHTLGEDVSSAVITFRLAQGKASISTLQCVITP